MSVSNGQKASVTIFNNAFLSKTTSGTTTGVVTLNNSTDVNSGASVSNVQRAINEIFDAVGITGIGDATRKDYSANNYVANGDTRKVAIGKLDAALKVVADALAALEQSFTLGISDGQSATDLTGVTADSAVHSSHIYTYEIIRGTTVFSTGVFALHYRNSTWQLVMGEDRMDDSADDHGVTFSLTGTTTAQVQAATTSGPGAGSIKLKRKVFGV